MASRIVEAMSDQVKMSRINLRAQTFDRRSSSQEPFKECFSSDKQNDDALQHLHDIFRHVLRKTIDVNTTMLQRGKQQRSENHADWMITSEQGDSDSRKSVVV